MVLSAVMCFDSLDCADETDHDADDDTDDGTDVDTNDDTDDDTDDGGRGILYTIKVFRGWVAVGSPWGGSRLGRGGQRRPTWTVTETETETTETTETETNPSAPGTPQANAPRDHICRSGHR